MIGFGQQTYVPDDNFEAYLEFNGMGNFIPNDDYVTTSNINTVTSLNVDNLNITDLTGIEDFTALVELVCHDNQLQNLDVSDCIALDMLMCYNNQLTSLDVSTNTALNSLHCSSNQLTNLDLSANTALTILGCDSNQLTSLDLSNNTGLTNLYCGSNQLTSLDVSQNTALTGLYCYSNQLTSLDIGNCSLLEYFYCNLNQLTILDVSNNIALTHFGCIYNQLTSLDLSNNLFLISLFCYNNQLTSLDLRNGNNTNMSPSGGNACNFTNNPNLYCIDVDNPVYSTAIWTVANGLISYWNSFSNDCQSEIFGCTDVLACNYNPLATIDDASCGYNNFSFDTLISPNSIIWNGNTLSVSGDYTDTLINLAGCDSITNLNLTVTTTGILDIANNKSNLVKITDMLGQETPYRRNTPLFYIYDDGTVEKRIVIE